MSLNNKHWHKEEVSRNFPRMKSGRNGYSFACFFHNFTSGEFWKILRNKTPVKMPLDSQGTLSVLEQNRAVHVCVSRTCIRPELHIHSIKDSVWARFVAQPKAVIAATGCSDSMRIWGCLLPRRSRWDLSGTDHPIPELCLTGSLASWKRGAAAEWWVNAGTWVCITSSYTGSMEGKASSGTAIKACT